MNAIECKNLTHYYKNKLVYENLSFNVPEGRILGLLGKNGTGKSTTINILNGFLQQKSGQCLIYGEDSQNLSPNTKARIGYLIEGHIQYSFMNIKQIEKFYSAFFAQWDSEPYWELMSKLKVTSKQKISTMSCGQRSQVALGLILAQNPDLLILDDFSMGLDPGYRRLFIDFLREYIKEKNKTIFATSHIIQDMERLIDDVLILDYNKILAQQPITELMGQYKQFNIKFKDSNYSFLDSKLFIQTTKYQKHIECFTQINKSEIEAILKLNNIDYTSINEINLNLEDIFIGLTGKY